MTITRLTRDGEQSLDPQAIAAWAASRTGTAPFATASRAACTELSRRLFADPLAARRPDLAALAYWLRPASVEAMEHSFRAELPAGCLAVPRGVVLQFPPANVDTVMVYGWALALLAGNFSVVRVSERMGDWGRHLLNVLFAVLEAEGLGENSLFLHTPRDEGVIAALSAQADVRVMWGGDASVAALRAIPAPPRCRDVLFPDRRSLAALPLAAYAVADESKRDALADSFATAAMTFGQMACSSPRLLAWVGKGDAEAATADFFPRVVAAIQRRGLDAPLHQALRRRTVAAGATLDGRAARWRELSGGVSLLDWGDLSHTVENWPGGGLFLLAHMDQLADLARYCDGTTQTLAVEGFDRADIAALIEAAGSRAPDRVVPFGQALAFDRLWDGMDLLREFTRLSFVLA